MDNGLRVGISGYGLAGRYFHAPLLKGVGFEVVGALTTNPDRIEHLQQDFPAALAVASIEELIALKLDLLVVASANIVHAEQAIAGLRAGIPVVVDKPMGLNLSQTQEIVNVSKETGVPVTTYFNRKWDSESLTIKKVLASGVLGEIFRLDSRFERFRPESNSGSWREFMSYEEGGGKLLDLQPHLVSLALDWFGPAQLQYSSVRSIRKMADDDSLLVLKHDSGVDSYLSASEVMGSTGPRIRLSGTRGALVIRDLDPQEALLRAGHFPENGKWSPSTATKAYLHQGDSVTEIDGENGNYATFYSLVEQAIRGTSAWPVTTEEALSVAKIIEEAKKNSVR